MDYYKLYLLVLCIALYVVGYSVYSCLTRKDIILYSAIVNVSVNESLAAQLDTGFLDYIGEDVARKATKLYTGLYLTDDESSPHHEYTHASRIKILASIDSGQLDVVLMNKSAFDAFSQNGYLCNLEELFLAHEPSMYNRLKPYLTTNAIISEDNFAELQFDPSLTYKAVIEERPVGLSLSEAALIQQAGFNDTVYLGIIKNSIRKDAAINYVKYLFSAESP